MGLQGHKGMGAIALGYVLLLICVLLVGLFFWGFWLMALVGLFFLYLWCRSEIGGFVYLLRYPFAFWLFILGEALIFASLFFTTL